jgi:hypothetical protein
MGHRRPMGLSSQTRNRGVHACMPRGQSPATPRSYVTQITQQGRFNVEWGKN